jgi:hypothetical protein
VVRYVPPGLNDSHHPSSVDGLFANEGRFISGMLGEVLRAPKMVML